MICLIRPFIKIIRTVIYLIEMIDVIEIEGRGFRNRTTGVGIAAERGAQLLHQSKANGVYHELIIAF